MGIYDREYFRQPPRRDSFARVPIMSVTMWLIVINVAMFVIDGISARTMQPRYPRVPHDGQIYVFPIPMSEIQYWLSFTAYSVIWQHEIWRFITFQFLHANTTHLVFNMIALYFFGPLIEAYLGRTKYLIFYLLCGIGGPIAYTLLWMLHFLIAYSWVPLVGASAGIFGVLIAAAQIAPNATVLLYGMVPMRLKTLAWVLLAIAAFTVLQYGNTGEGNAGGEAAHLGGAAIGFLLIRNPRLLSGIGALRRGRPAV